MKIQFNTDKTIHWNQKHNDYFDLQIQEELKRFSSYITRIEVHLSDENGIKDGINDIRCLLETRLEGRQPFVVSTKANTLEEAVSGAIVKMKASLKTILGRLKV